MDTETQPLSYADVLNLYRKHSSSPAVRGLDLKGYAQELNDLSGTHAFDQGLHDNFAKRFSVGLDEMLAKTGVPKLSGDLFGGIGSMISPGFEEAGRSMGEGLPRGILEGLPIGLAVAAPTPLTIGLAAAATGSAFSKGYTDTGSAGVGLVHAGVNLLFPEASRLGAKYLTGGLSKRLGTIAGDNAGSSHILEKMVDFAGEALGGTALAEAGGMASRAIAGQPILPTTKDLFADLIPNLAFAPFHVFTAVRGPKAGEYASVGHMLRAEEFARIQQAAQDAKQVTRVASTEEAKVPMPLEDDLPTADLWSQHVKLREDPKSPEYASQMTTVKDGSLYGEPIRPQEVGMPGGVMLLKGGKESPKPDAGLLRQINQVIGEPEGGARKLLPEKSTAKTFSDEELLAKSAAIIEQGVVGTGSVGLHEAATTANQLAETQGKPPVVTDATLVAKAEAHTDDGRTPEETLRKLQQATENKVNEEAAKVNAKKVNVAKADQQMAGLPPEIGNFLGEGIAKISKQKSADRLSDVASKNYTQAALNWLRKNPVSPEEINKWTPEQRAAKLQDLQATLGGTDRLAKMSAAKEEGKKGIVHLEEPVGMPASEAPKGANAFTKEAWNGEEEAFHERATEAIHSLVEGGDVRPEELKAAGLKADEIVGRKISAVLRDIALGASFGNIGNKNKKGFTFTPSVETKKIFGTDKNATIEKFVTSNLKSIRFILEQRLADKGVQLSLTGPVTYDKTKLWLQFDENKGGAPEGLAPATKAFFQRYYLAQGHEPATAMRFAEVAQRVALVYKDISRTQIGHLIDQTGFGLQGVAKSDPTTGGLMGVIGLNLKKLPITDQAFKAFFVNYLLGHETFHRIWSVEQGRAGEMDPVRLEKLGALKTGVDNMPEADREAILRSAFAHIVPIQYMMTAEKDSAGHMLNSFVKYGASNSEEFLATYMGLLSIGAASPRAKEFSQDILFSPKFMSDFAQMFYTDLRDVAGSVVEMSKAIGAQNTDVAQAVDRMHEGFNLMAQTSEEISNAVAELNRMETKTPKYFSQIVDRNDVGRIEVSKPSWLTALFPDSEIKAVALNYLERAGAVKSLEPYIGPHPNWFERNIMIPAHLRELYPVLGNLTDLIFGYQGQRNKMVTQGMTPFMQLDKFGKPTFDKNAPIIKVRSDPRMELAASEIMLEQNWQKRQFTQEDADKLTHFPSLSPEQKQTVMTMLQQHKEAMGGMREAITEYHKMAIADAIANIGIQKGGLRSKDAIDFGMTLVPILMDAADPTKLAEVKPTLDAVMTKVPPEVGAQIMQTFQELLPKFQKAQETLNSQAEYYSPETRMGNYYVRYVKDGQRHFVGKADAVETAKYVEGLKANKSVEDGSIQVASKYDNQRDVNTLYTDIINVFSDIEKTAYEGAVNKVEDPEMKELFHKLYTPGEAVFKEVTARGFGKHFLQRSLVPGREEINMVEGMVAYITGMSTGMAKSVTKRRAGLLLADPEMKENPALRNLSRDYTLTVVDPPAREWSKVKSMAFHMYLGGNLSSLLVERMQPLFTLAPELTRQGAGLAGGYKLIGQGMKALFNIATKGDSGLPKEWAVGDMMKRAQDEQRLDFGVLQELQGLDTDSTIINLRNASYGADSLSPKDLLLKPIYGYLQFTRGLYMHATSYNAKTAFMSGYIFKKQQGATNADAYNFAVHTTEATMFGGGAASRPIGLFANKGQMTGAIGALYTLRHYGFSMISDYYRLAKDSLGKAGLTEPEVGNARKALGQMVATQILMSGAMGLPMVGAATSILEQLFPNAQIKSMLREGLASLGSGDAETGELISDIALKGVLSAMLPVDVSARFGLGDLFGLDANRGFDVKQIFGAPGSILERYVKGVQAVGTGQPMEAVQQFLPNSVGNIVKMYSDDAKIRDKNGNLIYEPNQAETVLSAIGFRPKVLAKYRDEQNMMIRADDVNKRELRSFHSNLADFLIQGKPDFVRQALMDRQLNDENYDAKTGLRSVVEYAQRKMYPIDTSTSGSKTAIPSKDAISGTYQQNRPVPTEQELLAVRKQMERSVGVPGAGQMHPRELQKAQVVDYLMHLNPTMTRLHAQALSERMLGGIAANRGKPPLNFPGGSE